MCLLKLKEDEDEIIRWAKQVCFILTGDRDYCQMDREI